MPFSLKHIGICIVMAQFPSINPFRWGAWFMLASSCLYLIAFVAIFKETKRFKMPECNGTVSRGRRSESCSCKELLVSLLLLLTNV